MKYNKLMIGAWIIALCAVVGLVFFLVQKKSDIKKYEGLVTQLDVQITDENRTLLNQRISVNKTAIENKKKEDFDSSLYIQLADDAQQIGDLVLARETYETILNYNPLEITTWINYGRTLMLMQDYDEAESAFKQVLQIGGGSEATIRDLYNAIDKQNVNESRTDELRRILELGVEGVGQTPWLMIMLGNWYKENDDCVRAKEHYTVARTIVSEEQKKEIDQYIKQLKSVCK